VSEISSRKSFLGQFVVFALLLFVVSAVLLLTGLWRDAARALGFSNPDTTVELPPLRPTVTEARRKLAEGDLPAASRIARDLLADKPKSPEVLLIAGEAATKQKRLDDALRYYDAVPADRSAEFVTALWSAGSILLHSGQLSNAELKFRKILEMEPSNLIAHRNLAFLHCSTGRRFESIPHLFALLKSGTATIEDLMFLGNPVHTIDNSEFLKFAREINPNDPLPAIGLASVALYHSKKEEARELLKTATANRSELPEAQALLGRLIFELNDAEAIEKWSRSIGPAAEQHPEVWFVRGVWAEEHGDAESAIRCYWETTRRHPDHARANYRLGQLLVRQGKLDWAQIFSERAQKQEELNNALGPMYIQGPELTRMARAAKLTEELGRIWEAWGWNRSILATFSNDEHAQQNVARLEKEIEKNPPRVIAYMDATLRSGLSNYPLPSGVLAERVRPEKQHPATKAGPFRFADVASQVGINFQYVNGDDPKEPGTPIYQQLGGGIVASDFDRDGWPDLYLSQGSHWPPDEMQTEFTDRLFRSQGQNKNAFTDVTQQAGLGDTRYSQGATAGDVNNDGFPDLYVANIGGNRLYCNQGDGTFIECEIESNQRPDWTTSCMIADVNGDTLPDIFDVNYLDGRAPFETVCRGGKSCTPNHFVGQQDQLYLSRGDGLFTRVSDEAGIVAPDGKGLGIVAADFDGTGRLALFIANDTTANHFYVPQTERGADKYQLANQALLAGLAFDRDGRAQACMGIGADDSDHDGQLDLYITNFYNESNTLYKQVGPDLFIDATRESNLRESSLKMLGFGTQFLDADLDGHPDLVLTNGHVDDYTDTGAAYKMPPQFHRNEGNGRFDEIPGNSLGQYFEGTYLGRSLAKLDFNRDGRADFAVVHLDAPFALLANETQTANHFLTLNLSGVQCDRDAIGTKVTVETEAGKTGVQVRQLTAGDGYQASNQRALILGLGNANVIKSLTVRWPHGVEQTFHDVPVDREVLLVEGRSELVELP
jgi:tetratricopeptide (TPR) repeat protein